MLVEVLRTFQGPSLYTSHTKQQVKLWFHTFESLRFYIRDGKTNERRR